MGGWEKDEWNTDTWAAAADTTQAGADDAQWQRDDAWWSHDDRNAAPTEGGNGDAGVSWDSAGAAAHPPPEAANDPWAGGGTAAADQAWGNQDAAPVPNGAAFWEAQKYYVECGTLPKKEDWEMDQDDYNLFVERLGSSAGIDFVKYDTVPVDLSGDKASLVPVVQTFEEMYTTFKDVIPGALIENVRRCQYERPTPVQKFAIPVGLVGRDVMCCAQTGSGKTAAFLFPIIGRMMKTHESPVGARDTPFEGRVEPDTLIMTPTRELCIQIYEEAQKFCHRTPYRVTRVYGGEKPKEQMTEIARGADVMVATPGRLQDFINRGIIGVEHTFVLVLDEADRMLDMGFEPQIRDICEGHGMPSKDNRQTMMFSATFPESCQKMAQDFLYDYIWIGVGIVGGAVDTVEQRIVQVKPTDKYEKLFEALDDFFATRADKERCLVFVNAKDTAKWLDEQLYEKKIDTGALHGNLTQTERETNLRRFRSGDIDVMIATDVASRGLDIEKVGMVINYDMPTSIDSYVHRIGRTGRIGNKGIAITFIACENDSTLENVSMLKDLLRIMRDVGSATPDWLEGLIEQGESNGYDKWGGKDCRQMWDDTAGAWENWSQPAAQTTTAW